MLEWLPLLPFCIGTSCVVLSVVAQTRGLRAAPYNGVAAVSYTLGSLGCGLVGDTLNAYTGAAVAAANGWLWWRNGGGDGTRRRLKSWAAGFQGVRRTAPSHT